MGINDESFEESEYNRCCAITVDGRCMCSLTEGHSGRHIHHTDGVPAYGWREGAYSAFSMKDGASA